MKFAILFLLSFLCCAHGYFLDASCDSIKPLVKTQVTHAMNLARNALKELKDDKDENIRELRGMFFRDQDTDTVKGVYESVQRFKVFDEPNSDSLVQPTLYCDFSRFEEVTRKTKDDTEEKVLYDTKNKVVRKISGAYTRCKGGKTLAYRSRMEQDGKVYHSIQICPWYLNAMGHAQFKNVDGTFPRPKGWEKLRPRYDTSRIPQARVWGQRLDAVLLHEFTHAIPNENGRAVDVEGGRGWKPCIALGLEKGCLNADSYKYFALGVHMIKKEKLKFNKTGYMVKLSEKLTKRAGQLVMRLWNA